MPKSLLMPMTTHTEVPSGRVDHHRGEGRPDDPSTTLSQLAPINLFVECGLNRDTAADDGVSPMSFNFSRRLPDALRGVRLGSEPIRESRHVRTTTLSSR